MDYAMTLYKDADAIFLFSGLEIFKYYSQFGFESKSRKSISTKQKFQINKKFNFKKLDVNNQRDMDLLANIANRRVGLNNSMYFSDAHTILYFYITFVFSNEIYIDEAQETIIIYSNENFVITIHDLITTKSVSYKEVLESIVDEDTVTINFKFDINSNKIKLEKEKYDAIKLNSLLLIKGDFDCSKHVFPNTYHA
jgi:hypothetical protein